MVKSITRTVLFFLLIQLVCVLVLCLNNSITVRLAIGYSVTLLALHFLLWAFLMRFRDEFYNTITNQHLDRINAANRITLLRISSLPTIALLLNHMDMIEMKTLLPVLVGLVFLTDTIDGQIARRGKQITRIGQMLDSISDYLLLGVISVVYLWHDIVPVWFFYLIACRLFLQGLGMLIFILMKKPVAQRSTWGGKITIATTMILYVLELIRLYLPASFDFFFRIAEYLAGLIILTLSFEKLSIFFRHAKLVPQQPR